MDFCLASRCHVLCHILALSERAKSILPEIAACPFRQERTSALHSSAMATPEGKDLQAGARGLGLRGKNKQGSWIRCPQGPLLSLCVSDTGWEQRTLAFDSKGWAVGKGDFDWIKTSGLIFLPTARRDCVGWDFSHPLFSKRELSLWFERVVWPAENWCRIWEWPQTHQP